MVLAGLNVSSVFGCVIGWCELEKLDALRLLLTVMIECLTSITSKYGTDNDKYKDVTVAQVSHSDAHQAQTSK